MDVSLIESMPHVMPTADADMAEPLHAELRSHGVRLLLNSRVQSIDLAEPQHGAKAASVSVKTSAGDVLEADIVLMCVGLKARKDLARACGLEMGSSGISVNEYLQTSDPSIYAVGDMTETENVISFEWTTLMLAGPANRQGRCAANSIMNKEHRYRGNVGTAICKVFNLTFASTGLPVFRLRSLHRPVQWITVHPPHHAAYYPGASPITLRVAFDPESGHILGAQAVGTAGVDKRIDVLSTALLASMTIRKSCNS
jgi:NADPH-dependent 2,4-dienoyl-CoA reductase/sulfur reductase-like enzyme